jgi:eukaryotic-like serine/threonine-protein kinase
MVASFSPGVVLAGKYRVERVLGAGGMGTVVEATHLVLGQRVALKLLNESVAASEEAVARFLLEAQIAAQLPADHIVRVTDVGRTETGVPYLVMELLSGNDLANEIERLGRLPIADAVDYVLQAAEGLAEAHAVGLVHRDVKPANLFLSRRRGRETVVKVLDFGLSKAPVGRAAAGVSLTAVGSTFGTPQYMSPEQLESTKHVDARCDQHALAMILFELLVGRPAFEANTVFDLVVVIATRKAPSARSFRPEIPPALDAAIGTALAKDREDRFPSLAELAAAIAPFGGPGAAQWARNVGTAFAKRGVSAPPPPLPGEEPATPYPHPESIPGLTSSKDPLKGMRRRSPGLLLGAVSAVALLALGVLAVEHALSPSPATGVSTAPVEASIAAQAPAVAPPVVAPAPSSLSTDSPPASASAAPSSSAASPPAAPAHPTSRRPAQDAIKAFGDKRK